MVHVDCLGIGVLRSAPISIIGTGRSGTTLLRFILNRPSEFPEFPELQKFLQFWQQKLEGPLHSVQVAHCKLIKPAELKPINGEFRLH